MRPTRCRPRVSRRDRGATLVELALLCPLICRVLPGMATRGIALSQKNSKENLDREDAWFGGTLQENAGWANAMRDHTVSLSGGDRSAPTCARSW